jgi:hypothetical protein
MEMKSFQRLRKYAKTIMSSEKTGMDLISFIKILEDLELWMLELELTQVG